MTNPLSDVVERLCAHLRMHMARECHEAAATIERLSAELEETYAAFRWVYENGVVPHPVRPQWVSDVFNNAYASQRIARASNTAEDTRHD